MSPVCKKTKMFSAALVLIVTKKKTHTHTLSKLDLKNPLQAFSKYDLENVLHIENCLRFEKKQKNVFRRVGFNCDGKQTRTIQIGFGKCITDFSNMIWKTRTNNNCLLFGKKQKCFPPHWF